MCRHDRSRNARDRRCFPSRYSSIHSLSLGKRLVCQGANVKGPVHHKRNQHGASTGWLFTLYGLAPSIQDRPVNNSADPAITRAPEILRRFFTNIFSVKISPCGLRKILCRPSVVMHLVDVDPTNACTTYVTHIFKQQCASGLSPCSLSRCFPVKTSHEYMGQSSGRCGRVHGRRAFGRVGWGRRGASV